MECILSTFRELEEEITVTIQRCNSLINESCHDVNSDQNLDLKEGLNIQEKKNSTEHYDHSRIVWRRVENGIATKQKNGTTMEKMEGRACKGMTGTASQITNGAATEQRNLIAYVDPNEVPSKSSVSKLSESEKPKKEVQRKTSFATIIETRTEDYSEMDYSGLEDAVMVEKLNYCMDSCENGNENHDCIYANVSIDVNEAQKAERKVKLKIDITDDSKSQRAPRDNCTMTERNSRMYKIHIPVPKNMNLLDEEGFLYVLNSVLYNEKETIACGSEAVVEEEVYEYFV